MAFVAAKPTTDNESRVFDAPDPIKPEQLTRPQIGRLSDAETARYNLRRYTWNNNLGPFNTTQAEELEGHLCDIVNSTLCRTTADTFPMASLSGSPGLGKAHTVKDFAMKFHLEEIERFGPMTEDGNERRPVMRVGMRGNTSLKDCNSALCDFYAHRGE